MEKLGDADIGRIVRAYERRLAEHGFDVAALKSGGLGKQFVRHSVHAGMFPLKGRRVLDVGCGIGMFYRFLKNSGAEIGAYTGIDIVEPFLEYNRNVYPEARFLKLDIFSDPVADLEPDVVFMSQIFNARYERADNGAVARAAVTRMFEAAREGVVVDFMSIYVDYREPEHHYFEPEEMLRFGKSLTRYAALHHDYLPFEFTLVLRKEPSIALPDASEVRAYD